MNAPFREQTNRLLWGLWQVTHLDGRKVLVERTGVTACGTTMRLPGEGMPKRQKSRRGEAAAAAAGLLAPGFGDLVVTFAVEFPEAIPGGRDQRDQIRQSLTGW